MTEEKKTAKYGPRKDVDWVAVERHFRAGIMPIAQISREYGVSRKAIDKRADSGNWVRDIAVKVAKSTERKIIEKVVAQHAEQVAAESEPAVAPQVAGRTPPATLPSRPTKDQIRRAKDEALIEDFSEVASEVDLAQRKTVSRALRVQDSMLDELEALTDPRFREFLEELAEQKDESGPTPGGGWKTDKINELYRYVISLAGRIKMTKELGAAHGVYLPLQRKMFKLDEGKSAAPFEELLARLGSAQQEA